MNDTYGNAKSYDLNDTLTDNSSDKIDDKNESDNKSDNRAINIGEYFRTQCRVYDPVLLDKLQKQGFHF